MQQLQITQTIIRFPDIKLKTRDAHKLRGYFGNLFKEHSPLLHNHYQDGTFRVAYPLVQYKVIDGCPVLVGFKEGSELLLSLFLRIGAIEIEGQHIPVLAKNIVQTEFTLSVDQQFHGYTFETLWMALNQKNYREYIQLRESEKQPFLNRQLQNNILSFFKGLSFRVDERIMAFVEVKEKATLFKNQRMKVFSGKFTTNARLPKWAGIGKAVSRGFGTISPLLTL